MRVQNMANPCRTQADSLRVLCSLSGSESVQPPETL